MTAAVNRRTVVVAGAAVGAGTLVAGCATEAPVAPAPAAAGTVLGPATDVPVGSAKIYGAQKVVVTQPTAGIFDAFSTVCPHQGCTVASVTAGKIVCPCHNSTFAIDGSVVQGPAKSGLSRTSVTVTNGQISLA